jgi:dTMP kinase
VNQRGIHIVFEGPEAVGKSTQIQRAGQWLQDQGHNVVLTREPGDTPLGKELRRLLLDSDMHIDPRAEALMMAADRAQNVADVVVPNLDAGTIVISDRHIPSSLVYQGVVRGLGIETIAELSAFACNGHSADLVLVLDLDDDLARARAKAEPDRMEREGEEFHQNVRDAYRELTTTFGWQRVDAFGDEDEVFARITDLISPLLDDKSV